MLCVCMFSHFECDEVDLPGPKIVAYRLDKLNFSCELSMQGMSIFSLKWEWSLICTKASINTLFPLLLSLWLMMSASMDQLEHLLSHLVILIKLLHPVKCIMSVQSHPVRWTLTIQRAVQLMCKLGYGSHSPINFLR